MKIIILNLLIFIVGVAVGIFAFSNTILPIVFVLPKVLRLVSKGELEKRAIKMCFIAPASWIIGIGLTVLVRPLFHFLSTHFFYQGILIGVIIHIFGLLRKETQNDIREEITQFIGMFNKTNE